MPKHIAIIMDGNRRLARSQGKNPLFGHRKGFEVLKRVGDYCLERGVKFFTVYAFSTENWKRSRREVNFLVNFFEEVLRTEIQGLHEKNIRLKFIGRLDKFSKTIQNLIREAEDLTRNNYKGVLSLAVNYGGHTEIIDAVKKIIKKKIAPEKVTEKVVEDNLYTVGLPDPDLIIRTSGEMRLSNFLTWQSAYSELLFVNKHWPDFSEKDLDEAIEEYSRRQRRFGA